jgi:hypothetical protein
MNIQAAWLRFHPSCVLALLGAVAFTAGCVPGEGLPEPEPPAAGPCQADADCHADAPHCAGDGACVACLTNDHCAATPETPVCDETPACRACQAHEECASDFCNRDTGACVAESEVLYVAQDGTGDCSRASPCGSIATALDLVRADNDAWTAIRLDGGTYAETLALSDITVRIAGDDATIQPSLAGQPGVPAPDPTHGAAVVSVGERAYVTLERVRIQGDPAAAGVSGVHCFGGEVGTLALFRVTVADHAGLGIMTEGCHLTLARSAVTRNASGGLLVNDSAFDVTNSYFLDNGDVASSAVSGVTIRNDAPVTFQRFAFNTVLGNRAGPEADASGVSCETHGYLVASNNIVRVGLGARRSEAGDCTWTHSLLEGMSPIDTAAFFYQKNVDSDCVLHTRANGLPTITAGTPCDGAGEPVFGVLVDHDGGLRSPTAPDIGADEL